MSQQTPNPQDPVPSVATPNRLILPDHSKRDTLIAISVGVAVMAILVFAIAKMGGTSRGVTTVIEEKIFIARPETQLTVGTGGLSKRELAGQYRLIVRDPRTDKYYTVAMPNEKSFNSVKEGDAYFLVRPQMRETTKPKPKAEAPPTHP